MNQISLNFFKNKTNVLLFNNGGGNNFFYIINNIFKTLLFIVFFQIINIEKTISQDDCPLGSQLQCQEQALFTYALVENTSNPNTGFDLFCNNFLTAYANYVHTYSLYRVNGATSQLVETRTGANVHFIVPFFNEINYRVTHCIAKPKGGTGGIEAAFCGLDFSVTRNNSCCDLTYRLSSNAVSRWFLNGTPLNPNPNTAVNAVNTTLNNVNTYDFNTLNFSRTVSFGAVPLNLPMSVTTAQLGIFVGSGCSSNSISSVVSSLNGALLFPGMSVANRSISVTGTLNMDKIFTVSNCDMCMNPSSRILVDNVTTTFNQATNIHEAACKSASWYGIVTRGNPGKIVRLRIEDCTITGAYNAIRSGTSYFTLLLLARNTFSRNYIGINVNTPTLFSIFEDNTFTSTGNGYPSHSTTCPWVIPISNTKPITSVPFAGIYANPAPGVTSDYDVVLPSDRINTFNNIANGLYLENTTAVIRSCQVSNLVCNAYGIDGGYGLFFNTRLANSLSQMGFGKAGPLSFSGCRHGIYIAVSNIDAMIRCSQNRMSVENGISVDAKQNGGFGNTSSLFNNDITYGVGACSNAIAIMHGIWVFNDKPSAGTTSNLNITQNRIFTSSTTAGTGVKLQSTVGNVNGRFNKVSLLNNTNTSTTDGIYNGNIGIRVENFTNALVQNNNVQDFGFSGIDLRNANTNSIRCNTTTAPNTGFRVGNYNAASPNNKYQYNRTNSTNIGMLYDGACNNGILECNRIEGHSTGLQYQNAIVGLQSPNSTSNGNIWINNNPLDANLIGGSGNNTFFYRSGEINTSKIRPMTGWFNFVTNGNTCGVGCPTGPTLATTNTPSDKDVASNNTGQTGLNVYLLNRQLYSKLLLNPTLPSQDAIINSFYQNYSNTNGGKISVVEHGIYTGLAINDVQQAAMSKAGNDLDSIQNLLVQLDEAVINGEDPDNQTTKRDNLNNQASNLKSTVNTIYANNLASRVAQSTALLASLNSISPSNVWETNEKELDAIMLTTKFVDVDPTDLQKAQILAIASQCQNDGGTAVNRARAWYFELTGFGVSVTCNGAVERSSGSNIITEAKALPNMVFSPNPTADKVHIQFPESAENVEFLDIYNIANGHRTSIMYLAPDAKSADVDTHEYVSGTYLCKLHGKDKMLSVSKFIISRK